MRILYFAWLRQKIGRSEETLEETPASVSALIELLRARGGGYETAFENLSALRCAVNQEHTGFDTALKAADEVAFFPPVTGG